MLVFIAINVNGLLIPFYLQDIYGLSAFKTGTLILFYSVPLIVVAPISGWLSGKIGSRKLTVCSMIVVICGLLWYMGLGAEFKEYQIILGQMILFLLINQKELELIMKVLCQLLQGMVLVILLS